MKLQLLSRKMEVKLLTSDLSQETVLLSLFFDNFVKGFSSIRIPLNESCKMSRYYMHGYNSTRPLIGC